MWHVKKQHQSLFLWGWDCVNETRDCSYFASSLKHILSGSLSRRHHCSCNLDIFSFVHFFFFLRKQWMFCVWQRRAAACVNWCTRSEPQGQTHVSLIKENCRWERKMSLWRGVSSSRVSPQEMFVSDRNARRFNHIPAKFKQTDRPFVNVGVVHLIFREASSWSCCELHNIYIL